MLILFLDCETSGVNPSSDQIIELSGAVFSFDPITNDLNYQDKFSTLVRLRSKLDDRITRLTGITAGELEDAPTLFLAQENWQEWLSSIESNGGIKAIVGHSVDFDLGFLKKEGWYLPSCQIIDTLDLCRILMPSKSAINLEFLAKNLELEAMIPKDRIQNISYHRSLFDTLIDAELFQILLRIIQNSVNDKFLIDLIHDNFLDIGIHHYTLESNSDSKKIVPNDELNNDSQLIPPNFNTKTLNLTPTGEILSSKLDINNLQSVPDAKKILSSLLEEYSDSSLNPKSKKELILSISQIYYCLITKEINPTLHLKLHSQGESKSQYILLNLLLELIDTNFNSQNPTKNSNPELKNCHPELVSGSKKVENEAQSDSEMSSVLKPNYSLNNLESILDSIPQLTDTKLNLGIYINQLETLINLHTKPNITITKLQKLISQYDFLIMSMNTVMKGKYEVSYEPNQLTGADLNVFKKLFGFIKELQDWNSQEILELQVTNQISTKLIEDLISKINLESSNLQFSSSDSFRINLYSHNLILTKTNLSFNLNSHWTNLLQNYPQCVVNTELRTHSLSELKTFIDLPRDIVVKTNIPKTPIIDSNLTIPELLKEQLKELRANPDQIIITLTSMNSAMGNVDKFFNKNNTNSQLTSNFLILGESGSLTKISSKIATGFRGIVAIKFNQISTMINILNSTQLIGKVTIVLVEPPLFIPHLYWRNTFKEYDNYRLIQSQITEIYQEYKINNIIRTINPVRIIVNRMD
jgi:DNA polymerase III epsilon subunit-like protein